MISTQEASILQRRSGFTLIEVLIAVVIFTIGILAANALQIGAIGYNSIANQISKSTAFGASRIESLTSLNYDDGQLDDSDGDGAAGLDDSECCPDGNDPVGTVVAGCVDLSDGCMEQDGMFIYWNIADDVLFPDIKSINVIVTRMDGDVVKTVAIPYTKSKSL